MVANLISDPKIIVKLNFLGCITEENLDAVTERSGIYVAFVCNKYLSKYGCYICTRIAYIGKAEGTDNLRNRIRQHFSEAHKKWAEICQLSDNETFVYTYAVFEDERLSDVEAALIYCNKPIVNKHNIDRYTGKSWLIYVECIGNTGLLESNAVGVKFIK